MVNSTTSRWSGTLAALGVCALVSAAPVHAQSPAAQPAVTFAKDIAPIFQDKCEICHRAEAWRRCRSPPTAKPAPGPAPSSGAYPSTRCRRRYIDKTVGVQHFANDRSLSDAQIDAIVRWVDAGAPLGNERDLPARRVWPVEEAWEFAGYFGRPPDLIVKSPTTKCRRCPRIAGGKCEGSPRFPKIAGSPGPRRGPPAIASRRASCHHLSVPEGVTQGRQVQGIDARRRRRCLGALSKRQA